MKKLLAIFLLFSSIQSVAFAYTDAQLADAIFIAEGVHSKHPYGILKKFKNTTPRQACLNTIAHARRDWNGQGDFIEFLGNRYAPVNMGKNSNDPKNLNKNWIKNVRRFLKWGK